MLSKKLPKITKNVFKTKNYIFLNLLMFELDFLLGNKCSIDHKIKQNSTKF